MADTITTWIPISAPTDFQDDAVFNIDFKTKTVQVLVEQPIVAGENLSQFIKFQAPRFYDNIDLTEMSVNILYVSPAGNKGISAAVNTEYSDDMIRCGWLVPYAACPEKGTLLFVLEFVGADYTLKTTIASTPVLDSINDADVVPEPAEQAWYITLQANVSAALQEAQTALGRIESIFNALSAPMSAGTAVEMADKTAIYVYTGSETGYTYGNWYYYDGTAWTSGGAYASTALVTDPTLSQSGQAADAKETGKVRDDVILDETTLLQAPLSIARFETYSYWTFGSRISPTTGITSNNEPAYCRSTWVSITEPILVTMDNPDYEWCVWGYSNNASAAGTYSPSPDYSDRPVIIRPIKGTTYFRLSVRRKDLATLTTPYSDQTSDAYKILTSLKTLVLTDDTLSVAGVPADAKAVGDMIAALTVAEGTAWD